MKKKFRATESLRYNLRKCSSISQWWWDHRIQYPATSDLARNMFFIMVTSTASEQVFTMAMPVVNSRRANLKS